MLSEYPATKLLQQLAADNLLPAILFRTSRKQCDADIERLSRMRGALLKPAQQHSLAREIDQIIEAYGMDAQVIHNHLQYPALLATAAGAHHAGQLLMWRLLLEELMTRGSLRLMIATGTVAAGVDFPARTVVITAHSKRGAEGFNTLSSAEFQQMSGRAGRRGKDTIGICLVAPGPFSDARVIHEVARKPPEPLRSSYFASASTVLNLLKFRNVDDLKFTVSRSLGSFHDRKIALEHRMQAGQLEAEISERYGAQQEEGASEAEKKARKRVRRIMRDADECETRQMTTLEKMLSGLERLGFVKGGILTEKGIWSANLCTNLVLELAEAISEFVFDGLNAEMLAALVATIAGDSHRHYLSIRQNPVPEEALDKLRAIVLRVRDAFEDPPNSELEVLPNGAVTVLTWMESEDWVSFSGLLRLGGVAEGDAARLIMQTAEHLGQMSRLFETHPDLSRTAAEGRRRLLRPPLSEAMVD